MSLKQSAELIRQGYQNLQQNDLIKAKNCFNRAKKLDPDSFDAWFAFGSICLRLSDFQQAESALTTVLTIMPEHPVAHVQLGVALYHLGRIDEAILRYEKFIDLQPDNAAAYINLGIAYIDVGRRDEAVSVCLKAIEINPDFVGAYILLASANSALGKFEEALKNYDDALIIEPANMKALAGKADALIKLGYKKEAYNLINNEIDESNIIPDIAVSFAAVSSVAGREKDALHYLEAALQKNDLINNQRLQIHFSAGKLYDKLEDYNSAFTHYHAGNELVHKSYDAVADRKLFNDIAEVFSSDNLKKMPRAQSDKLTPVFVIGMPRSGTSLVERILGGHSKVFPAGELGDVPKIAEQLASAKNNNLKYPAGITDINEELLGQLSGNYLAHLEDNIGECQIVVDKLPHNFLFIGLIEILFPDAKIIHCTRDPLDTCLSNYFQFFSSPLEYPYKLENIAGHYNNYQRLMKHWERVIRLPMYELKYEDLIYDQILVTKDLFRFMDIPFEESCLKFYETDYVTRTASNDQTSEPVYTSSVGRWRHYDKHIKVLIDNLKL